VLLPRIETEREYIHGLRADRIMKVDPALLYFIIYQSRALPSGKHLDAKQLQVDSLDEAVLTDPRVAQSLIIASLPKPSYQIPASPKFVLCIDKVIFPDNVGSLIRSSKCVGSVDAILATQGSCDYFGWKVLEASGGLGLDIPVQSGMNHSEIAEFARKHRLLPIVGSSGVGVDPKDIQLSSDYEGLMVIIGNETHGPSQELLDVAVRARIPINERMNSLNAGVAGGILLQVANSILHRPK
jgi:tRNA G18 (ribose-2'-O)-methylase SpoU